MTKYTCKNCKKDFLNTAISRPPIYCGLDCNYAALRGQKRPKEIGEKISAKRKGMKFTEEHRRNLSIALKGPRPWRKTSIKRKCLICATEFEVMQCKIKNGRGKFCSRKCKDVSLIGHASFSWNTFKKGFTPWNKGTKGIMGHWNKGKKWTLDQRIKCSGENSSNWRGGITPEHKRIRNTIKYSEWRMAIFMRDNFTCTMCGRKRKKGDRVEIQADHIKPFAVYPELRFDTNNGRTLCRECHKNTPTYGVNWRRLQNLYGTRVK